MKRKLLGSLVLCLLLAVWNHPAGGESTTTEGLRAGVAAERFEPECVLPEGKQKQWENIEQYLREEYHECLEDCGDDRECAHRCGKAFKTRAEKECQKLLFQDIADHPSCPHCGMNRETFARSRVLLEYEGGMVVATCSLHCAVTDLDQHGFKAVQGFWVGDYKTKRLINARDAFWVIGGSQAGVMTVRGKWAFADKNEAESFIASYGGELSTFEDALTAARADMGDDSKMIQEKRAKAGGVESGPVAPGDKDKCPVCGMFVHKYPHWVSEIIFQDGSVVFFDGAKDLFKFYFDIAKFVPKRSQKDIQAMYVTEYYSAAMIKADEALYVSGSDVYGPMGVELIPFKTEADAKQFTEDHKGKRTLRFRDITPKVIETLSVD